MSTWRRAIWTAIAAAGVSVAPLAAGHASAAPAAQQVSIEVSPPRLQVYPLGTARIQTVLANPSKKEQVFALEILLVRGDGTIVTAFLSDALSMAGGAEAQAIYTVKHADGAVEAIVTPRPWPELAP
jgi:hypothetical protein